MWWPARAVLGDLTRARRRARRRASRCSAAAIVAVLGRFGEHAIAAAGVSAARQRGSAARRGFRRRSPARVLRQKEWTLLLRDPWLASQTLMQILYLLPPALMLWRTFGDGTGALVVLVPVLVMAAGQLAGGLAWLAISGEDAPDLVATAPIPARPHRARQDRGGDRQHRARVRAVRRRAGVCGRSPARCLRRSASSSAAAAATLIQFWFRKQATRRHFRRRQTSSRFATFAEAFSSISWAATAALAAAGTLARARSGAVALGIWLV